MKPVYVFVPYVMGDFDPPLIAIARHNWRLLTPVLPQGEPTERMGVLAKAIADEAANIRAEGKLPVLIAGDCTATIGLLAGLQRETPDLTLVWYDAHGDFNTHETTPSGFIGGMPLAMLCGRGEQTIVEGAGAKLQPEADIILTDARDLDPGEKEAVAESAVQHLPDVAALTTLALPDKPIYIHFDCDVLRLSDMKAVNYPAEGGPSLETIDTSLTHLAQTGQVIAVSLTLWEPEKDEQGAADETVMGIIERLVEQI